MIRIPSESERAFVRNQTEWQVTFAPKSLLVLPHGCGVFVDENWASFDDFRHDQSVMLLWSRGRISVEYLPYPEAK